MGGQESKPEQKEHDRPQQQDKKDQAQNSPRQSQRQNANGSPELNNRDSSLNKSPRISPRQSINNPKSNRQSATGNYPEQMNSQRGAQLIDNIIKSNKNSRSPSKLSNKKAHQTNHEEDNNEFMPLINWPATGEIKLTINLVELIVHNEEKPYLSKSNSTYNALFTWKKMSNNIFNFKLSEEPSYELNLEIDLQGEAMTGSDKIWIALCPLNIPFGRTVKLGPYKCVNLYKKISEYDLEEEDQEMGPSLKNIEFPISEQVFGKWGEQVPKSLQNLDKKGHQRARKQKQKMAQYEELSRYFSGQNTWLGTTYVEETSHYYRGWLIETSTIEESLSSELKKDLGFREKFYVEMMYRKLN